MKKILYILTFFLLMGGVQSCEKDIVSDVKGNADERANRQIEEWRKIMIDAENGWFANIMTKEGIYRFWMKFEDAEHVTMYTDNLRYKSEYLTTPETSTYRIEQYQRPTIIFDTYSYLSIINDPNNSISGGTENQGLITDFEFEIVELVDGNFELKGRINKVDAALIKATAEEYAEVQAGRMMTQLEKVSAFAGGKTFEFELNGSPVSVIIRPRQLMMIYNGGGKTEVFNANPYVEMNGNMTFAQPVQLGNVIFSGIKWDETNSAYTDLVSSSGSYSLTKVETPRIELHNIFGIHDNAIFHSIRYDAGTMSSLSSSIGSSISSYNFLMAIMGLLTGFTVSMTDVAVGFDFSADEGVVMVLTTTIQVVESDGNILTAPCLTTFNITFLDDEMKQFTVGTEYFADQISEGFTVASTLAGDFMGRTFEIKWTSDKILGEYLLGEMTRVIMPGETNTSAYRFIGSVEE